MQLGVDRLILDSKLRAKLHGRRLALLGHPASMTSLASGPLGFRHSLDALADLPDLKLTAAFGPQHGMRGDKQDNMVETADEFDPVHNIPVYSLYGKVRRPTPEMLASFDTLLFDVQDVGCRIYTFLTTLLYMLEACAEAGKSVWVLDRPNPAGRAVEGSLLLPGWESFVGAGPVPMRHGLTLGEAARWFVAHFKLKVDLTVISMLEYDPLAAPGFGWPAADLAWVNPSPNASNLSMVRCYAGTVMLEGTHLSEGRGTTRPLELLGAPDLDVPSILKAMHRIAPQWLKGCALRPCYFEPTFHKHSGKRCAGFQIHVDGPLYDPHAFQPYRLQALAFKAIREVHPNYEIWRSFPYEYETERLAIDLINGGPALREWVDDPRARAEDFENIVRPDEQAWRQQIQDVALYPLS